MKKQTTKLSVLMAFVVLFASVIACQQSGDIVTEAEATKRALPTVTPTAFVSEDAIPSGTVVYLVGKGYLINLVDAPGSFRMIAGQERGAEVTVLQNTVHQDAIWYLVKAPTGEGWVLEENVSLEKP